MHFKSGSNIQIWAHESITQISADEGINVGDEWHTLDELYDHRVALNAALFNLINEMKQIGELEDYEVIKAPKHNDGSLLEGYFVVSLNDCVRKQQISYHYKLEHWDKFRIPESNHVPWEYDGHISQDTLVRLINLTS